MNLPPTVNGKLYGYLKVMIDEVIWWRNPGVCCRHNVSIKSQWWGSDRVITYRPSDVVQSNCGSCHLHYRYYPTDSSSNCKKFEIRTTARLFERYLKYCDKLIFLIMDDTSKEILGKAIVENLCKLLTDEVVFQNNYYPILNKFNNRIGDIRICFDCQFKRVSVKPENCLPANKVDLNTSKSCKRLCNLSNSNVPRDDLKRNSKIFINNDTVTHRCGTENNNKFNYSTSKIQCSSKKRGDNAKVSIFKDSSSQHRICKVSKDNPSCSKNSSLFVNVVLDDLLRKCEKLKKAMVKSLIEDAQGSGDDFFYGSYLSNDGADADVLKDEMFCSYEKQNVGDVNSSSIDPFNEFNLSDYLLDDGLNLDLKNASGNDVHKRTDTKCDNHVQQVPLTDEDCLRLLSTKNLFSRSESDADIGEPMTRSLLSFDDFNVPDRKCETFCSINRYRLTIESLLFNQDKS